ncbi:MAG: YceI family protein [Planctomycetota bacterium]
MPATRTLAMTLSAAALATGALFLASPATQATGAAQDSGIKAGAFKVDPLHSNVNFRIVYMNSSHFFGRFNEFEGSYLVDPANADDSYIDITVKTTSVDTNSSGRDEHMRKGDFFASRQFPEATFKSTSAQRVDDDTIRFTGDFTIRGVTNEVTVDVDTVGSMTDRRANNGAGALRAGWITTLTFDRSDYNVTYGLGGLSDETELTISMTGLQQ